jgi:hypothetical protein
MSARRRSRATPAKAWAGRFDEPTAAIVERFTTSLPVDRRLYPQDIAGSAAHVRGLVRARLLTRREGQRLLRGLARVERELATRRFRFRASDEDIHMAIERRLTAIVGPLGGSSTPVAAATIRSRPTSGSGCAPSASRSTARSRGSRPRSGARPPATRPSSCRATRTCSARSRFCSRIICSPTTRCSRAIVAASATAARAPTRCRSAPARSPARASRSTARTSRASSPSAVRRRTASTR